MSSLTRNPVDTSKSFNVGVAPSTLATGSVPASDARQFLMMQNVHATQNIAFSVDGTTPALNTAGSFMLAPLQAIVLDTFLATNQINFIASGAATPITIATA